MIRKRKRPLQRQTERGRISSGRNDMKFNSITPALSLTQAARRYAVPHYIVMDWVRSNFLPRPHMSPTGPTFCPAALDQHDLIVWANGGQPSLEKVWALNVMNQR